jgi:thiamine pyrophosphate-dependent acetolactate synthase large subunit-like protein
LGRFSIAVIVLSSFYPPYVFIRAVEGSGMNVREVITESLHELDVETVFALGSTGILNVMGTLEQSDDIEVVHTRHEEGAIAMADAYARSGGDIGVAMVGMGPAVAHTGTGLVTARKFGSNLLLLVPAPSMTYETYFPKKRFEGFYEKSFDQDQYLSSTIENVVSVRGPDAIEPKLRDTIRRLRNGDGPIALQVPMDVFERDVPQDVDIESLVDTGGYTGAETRTIPDQSQITEAIELFLDSDVTKVPVVLAGAGAVQSGAKDVIEELAEQMNAVISTTLRGRGLLADHPYSVGLIGSYGSTVANKYITEADYVLAVGCSLNVRTTDSGHLINEDAKIVHIDIDESAIEQYEPVDVGSKGDARKTIEAITETLAAENIARSVTSWD